MGKRFMANLHASLDSTCKKRLSKISTRCQNLWGISQLLILNSEMNLNFFFQSGGGVLPQLLILNSEMNLKFFFQSGGGPSTTFDPELGNEFKNFSNHNFWSWTQKWILKFFQSWGGSMPQLLIQNWEMNLKHFQIVRGPCPQTHIHHTD